MKARNYQILAEQKTYEAWKDDNRSVLVVMATGCGKTILFSFIILHKVKETRKKVLVICERRELVEQTAKKIKEVTGLDVSIEMGEYKTEATDDMFSGRAQVIVTTVQTQASGGDGMGRLTKFDPDDFCLVIVDECFPAGTIVSGKPIEQIKVGDLVNCCDNEGNPAVRPVIKLFKNPVKALCKLSFSNGIKITCTLNHPFLTKRGYVAASMLKPCDMVLFSNHENKLQELWNRSNSYNKVSSRQVICGFGLILFARLFKSILPKCIFRNYVQNKSQICVCANEDKKSDAFGICAPKIKNNSKSDGMEAENSWRQWSSNYSTTSTIGCSGMGNGNRCSNQSKTSWLSNLLQIRCWKRVAESWNRNRRSFSLFFRATGAGQKKRKVFEWSRLESNQIFKRGRDEEFSKLCPEGFVYNIEVADYHNYFANGALVHNCHHSTANSYQRVLNYYKANDKLVILGVTATPDRADEEALGQVFGHVAFEYPILDAVGKPSGIRDGWLVPVVQQFVSATLDLSHISTQAGDLAGAELEAVLKAEKPMQEMIEAIFEIMHGLEPNTLAQFDTKDWFEACKSRPVKRAIAFTRFVNHAKMLSDILNRIQPGFAAYVHGAQDKNERRKIIDDFKRGKGAKVICNCNVLGEGYDDDGIKIVFMCCPTKSRSRYAQWVGRGTRPLEEVALRLNDIPAARQRRFEIMTSDKPEIRVVDFAGNSGRHKLVTCADILGGFVSDEAIEAAVSKVRNHGRPVKVDELLEEEELQQEQKRQREAEEAARKLRLVGKANYKLQTVDPFDLFQVKPVKERGWDAGKRPTDRMNGFLRKFGFDPAKFNFAQAGQLIGTIKDRLDKNLCTPKQALWLKNHGYSSDLQFEQAQAVMNAWQQNGWRRPQNLEIDSTCPPRPKVEEEDYIPF